MKKFDKNSTGYGPTHPSGLCKDKEMTSHKN